MRRERLKSLINNLFPRRYFRRHVHTTETVPAYFYHQIEAAEFELICQLISHKKFQSITFGQLLDRNFDSKKPAVLLTMDDGWSSVWSIAYPLAKKYGIRFTLFLVPEAIEVSYECRSTLEDGIDPKYLSERDFSNRPMLTWGEVKAMRDSGYVEIQSHSLNHSVVFTSEVLSQYVTPKGPFPRHDHVPLTLHVGNQDISNWHPPLGTPLYPVAPALVVSQRFIEDSQFRESCIAFVAANGGEKFFLTDDWESRLRTVCSPEQRTSVWETDTQRRDRFHRDLSNAKIQIEQQLPGTHIRALAPPWGMMHPDLPEVAQQTGHELLVLADPLPDIKYSPVPIYPRLKGNAIFPLLCGPVFGLIVWLKANQRSKARLAKGAIP
jgi:hypothetical protein